MSVMLTLGGFRFHIGAAAYNELQQSHSWRWQGQARIGLHDRLQFSGKDNDQITLNGSISTLFNGVGVGQLDRLKELGDRMEPLLLTSGQGDVMGYWVIVSFDGANSKFLQGGMPKQQTFSLVLKFYGEDIRNP